MLYILLFNLSMLNLNSPFQYAFKFTARILETILSPNGTTDLECTTIEDDGSQYKSGLIPSRYRWQNFNVFIDPD